MVHICFISHSLPIHRVGGLENHAESLFTGLANLGEKVTVFSTCHPNHVEYERINKNLEIYYFGGIPGIRDQRFFDQTVDFFWNIHESTPFDILISESNSGRAIILQKRTCPVPIIVINHGFWGEEIKTRWKRGDFRGKISGLIKLIEYISYPKSQRIELRAQRLITINKNHYDGYAHSNSYLKTHLALIYNGIDVSKFYPFPSTHFSDKLNLRSNHILVCTGRLAKEKGVQIIIHCLPELKKKYPDICFLVSGEGEYAADLKDLAKVLDVSEQIHFLGRIPYQEIPNLINNGHIYVFPTLRVEGLPYSVLEALACGAVIIGSNNPGVTEIIQSGFNGFLCSPSKDAFIESISYVFENPLVIPLIKQNARNDAIARFSLEQMVERIRTVIYEIVQKQS